MRWLSGTLPFAALLLIARTRAAAQDSATTQHRLSLDTSRARAFQRAYNITVHSQDSVVVIGERHLHFDTATYAGIGSWIVVESRTGVVPAADSLYLARDLSPVHWSSALGTARLGLEFARDSIYGATTSPMGRQNIVLRSRADLLLSQGMLETLFPLLPLDSTWRDSVTAFALDANANVIERAELAVIGQEDLAVDSLTRTPSWVVALRSTSRQVLYWVDKESRATLRVEQAVAPHVGTLLEYRIKPITTAAPP